MLKYYPSETFREIPIDVPLKFRYAISNYGRLISFSDEMYNGRLIKGGLSDGYRTLHYKMDVEENNKIKKKSKYLFLYKLVAEYFIPKTSEDQIHVLHLDHSRDNDIVKNLKWATPEEKRAHTQLSPRVIAAQKIVRRGIGGKLTTTHVIRLKKMLLDPNRKTRLRILAKQFGVSEMQLQRIKTGENWGYIVV